MSLGRALSKPSLIVWHKTSQAKANRVCVWLVLHRDESWKLPTACVLRWDSECFKILQFLHQKFHKYHVFCFYPDSFLLLLWHESKTSEALSWFWQEKLWDSCTAGIINASATNDNWIKCQCVLLYQCIYLPNMLYDLWSVTCFWYPGCRISEQANSMQ